MKRISDIAGTRILTALVVLGATGPYAHATTFDAARAENTRPSLAADSLGISDPAVFCDIFKAC